MRTERYPGTPEWPAGAGAAALAADPSSLPPYPIRVPWAEGSSRYTAQFEAEVIGWLKEASVKAVAGRMRLSWNAVDGIMQRAVTRGLARRKTEAVRRLSVDETSFRRRHRYVTVVSNPVTGHVLHVPRGGARTC